jgi:rRNA-processing protein FCF1
MPDVILDANVLRNIAQGNQIAAEALKHMLDSGRKVYISKAAYNELMGMEWAKGAQYRDLLKQLKIGTPPASANPGMIKARGDVYADNIMHQPKPSKGIPGPMTEYGGARDPMTGAKTRPGDAFVAAETKAVNGELWTLDKNLANRARAQGIKVAGESSLPSVGGAEDVGVARRLLREALPKPPTLSMAGLKSLLQSAKSGLKASLKAAFEPASLASLIPDVVLAIADKYAVRDALRNIETKFIKEGFAKGVAAGIMGWSEQEMQRNLLNRVSNFRVQGLGDAKGVLKLPQMLQVAEAYENYAVQVGFVYSAAKSTNWKKSMRDIGFSRLKQFGYSFANENSLFEYAFIDKLAFAIHHTTDAIVGPAITFH